MLSNDKWVCKEQCAQCRCIMKERVLKESRECKAPEPEEDCADVYEAFGSCLQQCLRDKCQQRMAKKNKSANGRGC